MEILSVIVISVFSLITCLSICYIIITNLLNKVETYENALSTLIPIMNKINNKVKLSDKQLRELDSTGGFESDDEIGQFFITLKNIQEELNKVTVSLDE